MNFFRHRKNSFIALLFFALSYLGIIHHEMWLDEMHHWLLSKDSNSLSQLIYNARYEGHPLFWNVVMFFVAQFTSNPFFAQLLHIAISSTAVFLFLKYAPFKIAQNILLVFGYFFFYEYNIIARNYNLAWLLLIIFCILFTRAKRNYFLLVLTLCVLANIHLLSLIVATCLFGLTLYTHLNDPTTNKKGFALLLILAFCLSATVSVYQIIPPGDSVFVKSYTNNSLSLIQFSKAFSILIKAYLPIPNYSIASVWNTNLILSHFKIISLALTFLLFLIPALIFIAKPIIFIFYHVCLMLIVLVLFRLSLFYGTRYTGFVYMIFIVSLWLSYDDRFATINTNKFGAQMQNSFLWLIISIHFFVGTYFFYMDYKFPFSQSKNIASFVQNFTSKNSLVILFPSQKGSEISGYLNKKVYSTQTAQFISFSDWQANAPINYDSAFNQLKQFVAVQNEKQLVIVMMNTDSSTIRLKNKIESNFNSGKYHIDKCGEFAASMSEINPYLVYTCSRN